MICTETLARGGACPGGISQPIRLEWGGITGYNRLMLTKLLRICTVALLVGLVASPGRARKVAVGTSGAVATADTFASAAAISILERGGNAVDAAVTAAFVLAVTYPQAGNIGGGGFMLVHTASGEDRFIDYREKAPIGASRNMYLDSSDRVIQGASTRGHLAVGVPGTVAGLSLAHELFGTLPWEDLVRPAYELARDGFPLSHALAEILAEKKSLFEPFEPSRRIFGLEHHAGDLFVQDDLSRTLGRIMEQGEADFYTGETASLIVEEMKRGGGLVTAEDLRRYEAVLREPVRTAYRGCDILGAPPPSSGGLIVGMLLRMMEEWDLHSLGFHSARHIHMVSEAEKIVYRLRALYMGDADFYPVPVGALLAPPYLRRLASLIDPARALPVGELERLNLSPRAIPPVRGEARQPAANQAESLETTHFSIIDRWGNAVANTYTLNSSFGSGVTVAGAGFLLNNEMDDFSIKPGYPNIYGLVGGEANAIEPEKRMLSSMSPTIVLRQRKPFLVLGTPGGSRIPTTVLQILVNVLDFEMGLEEAVAAGRFHEQYVPDLLYMEKNTAGQAIRAELERLGHVIEEVEPMCNVHAIIACGDSLLAVSDPRGTGCAMGY